MVVISIINIQRSNFTTIKNLFEKLFLESKIIDNKKNWINYSVEERRNQDLTSIMFEVEWNNLPTVIQVLLKNKVLFCNQDKDQPIEIGVNTNTIKILNINSEEDKQLIINGIKGYKIETLPNNTSTDLLLKFDTPLLQAQALETMLNFIQIEDYSLQSVFILDFSSTINQVELEKSLARIQSKLDTSSQNQQQQGNGVNCNVQINKKRKASNEQTEKISNLYEKKPAKKEEGGFTLNDLVQMILIAILVGLVSCVAKGKKFY